MGEDELIAAARRGDRAALERLLGEHEGEVYRFGLRMCGNEEDARDVLQETLLAAFRGLHEFRGDAAISTWLYRIARSFCTRARRAPMDRAPSVPTTGPEATALPDPRPEPEMAAHAGEVASVLREALLALPESQREVIVLRDVEGLSAEQAAAELGIAIPALKSRLHRARAALRHRVEGVLGV